MFIDALIYGVRDYSEDAVTEADANDEPLVQQCRPELCLIHLRRNPQIRQQRPSRIRLSFEFEAKRFTHNGMGAIRPDKEVASNFVLTLG